MMCFDFCQTSCLADDASATHCCAQNGSIHKSVFVTLKTETFNQQKQHQVKHMLCVSGFGIPFPWPGPVVLLSQDSSLSTTFFPLHASFLESPKIGTKQTDGLEEVVGEVVAPPCMHGLHLDHHSVQLMVFMLKVAQLFRPCQVHTQVIIWTDTLGTHYSCHQIHKQIYVQI